MAEQPAGRAAEPVPGPAGEPAAPMASPAFEREYGCTAAEWQRWLPGAVREHRLQPLSPGRAMVGIGAGRLHLAWTELPPRRIAQICLPRLAVHFRFEAVAAEAGAAFMRHFDLYLHRGGG